MHNLQNVDLDIPRDRLVVDHRPQRVGQELAGLRHALCRRAAAVHRKPLDLRPAVPPSTRTARRRSDRGPAADDLHRPAGRQPQSRAARWPRSPRSTITCGCSMPGWASRAATSAARRSASRSPEQILDALLALADGHADDDPGAAGPRPQRASTRTCSRRSARPGSSGPGSTARWSTSTIRRSWCRRRSHHIEAVVDRVVIREGVRDRGWPSRSTWPSGTATGWCWPATRRRRPAGRSLARPSFSARSTPAPTARSATRSSSRGPSASTAPTAPARRAKGWASRVAFDPDLVLPDAGAVAGRRGDRALERRHAGRAAEASQS